MNSPEVRELNTYGERLSPRYSLPVIYKSEFKALNPCHNYATKLYLNSPNS